MQIAFIGLGTIGYHMAYHLRRKNFALNLYNRTLARANQFVQDHGGRVCLTPREAAENADVVLLCVGNDADVSEVSVGKHGAIQSMKPGSVLIDHTTSSAVIAARLNEICLKESVQFLDAPVSGGESGAQSGSLTVMLGGEHETYHLVKPVLSCYAKKHTLIGPVGHGQLAKMVNQICIAGTLQGLCEGLRFAKHCGLDPERLITAISNGAAQSWQMDHRASTMLKRQYDFGFAIKWMIKDLGLCLDEAKTRNLNLSMVEGVMDKYRDLVAKKQMEVADTSGLFEAFFED